MLLVLGGVGSDSCRNLDQREPLHPKRPFFTRTRIQPNATQVCLCFENLQDGLNTTHTATHPLSGGVGRQHEQYTCDAACVQPWRVR